MVKEINQILKELKKHCPEGSGFSASAELATWADAQVRYTAHVLFPDGSPFKNICEISMEDHSALITKMLNEYDRQKEATHGKGE